MTGSIANLIYCACFIEVLRPEAYYDGSLRLIITAFNDPSNINSRLAESLKAMLSYEPDEELSQRGKHSPQLQAHKDTR